MLGRADSIQELLFWAPAANDNGRRPITMIEPIEPVTSDRAAMMASDPFDDVEAWLAWLSDCTVIESSIRRGLDHALGLDALGSGPPGDERFSEPDSK